MKKTVELKGNKSDFRPKDSKNDLLKQEQSEVLQPLNSKVGRGTPAQKKPYKFWNYYTAITAPCLTLLVLALLLFSNILQEGTRTLDEESIQQVMGGIEYNKILHQEEVGNGVVVFYIPKIETEDADSATTQLSFIFLKKTLSGWKKTDDRGGYSSNTKEEVTSQFAPGINSRSPFPMLYGEIKNPAISKINVMSPKSGNRYEAEIVTENKHHLWFVFLPGKSDPAYTIQGLSNEGEMIVSVDSENGETGSGRTLSDAVSQ